MARRSGAADDPSFLIKGNESDGEDAALITQRNWGQYPGCPPPLGV